MIDVIDRFVPVLDRIAFRHFAVTEPFNLRKNEPDPVCFLLPARNSSRTTSCTFAWALGVEKTIKRLVNRSKTPTLNGKTTLLNLCAKSVCEIGVIGAKAENVRGIWGRETNVDR